MIALLLTPLVRAGDAPDFQRDIRPILSNICFKCHGPDERERKGGKEGSGGLRFDELGTMRWPFFWKYSRKDDRISFEVISSL